jgi:hypothetical protein
MQQYLNDIEYAVTSIIHAIWQEQEAISKLDNEIIQLVKAADDKYQRAENIQQSEDIDDYMIGVGLMWEAYFNEDKEAYYMDKKLKVNIQTYQTHEFAINSLSGSLLQIAKQGISMKHGGLQNCPNGKNIGTQFLKNVIWQARNQAIHFEDGKFNPQVVACFDNLSIDIDPKFNRFRTSSMAYEVVELLGWKTFDDFKNDMMQFA